MDLLRLAEDAAFFMDIERIRVCFPPSAEEEDCLLLLDGIDEVPPPQTWYAMREVDHIGRTSPPKDGTSPCTSKTVSQHDSSGSANNVVHSTPSLIENEFSDAPAFHECANHESTPASPEVPFVCSKILFAPADGELCMDSTNPSAEAGYTIAITASPPSKTDPISEISTVVDESNTADEDNQDGILQSKVSEVLVDLPPVINTNIPVPVLPSFEQFQTEHHDRITWLSGSMPSITSSHTNVVYYHATQCFSVQENAALRAAMLLSAQLGVPLIALVSYCVLFFVRMQ